MNSQKCPRCGSANWVAAATCKRCGLALRPGARPLPAAGSYFGEARRPQKPFWVAVGLHSIKTRRAASAWLVASLVAIPCIFLGLFILLVALAGFPASVALAIALPCCFLALPASLWYWFSIRWMDTHDAWPAHD